MLKSNADQLVCLCGVIVLRENMRYGRREGNLLGVQGQDQGLSHPHTEQQSSVYQLKKAKTQ